MFLFFALGLILSPVQAKVTLIKQWHPSPGIDTTDIQKSKKRGEWVNQVDIFQKVSKMVKKDASRVVLIEGCEGEITKGSKIDHYGWDWKRLEKYHATAKFTDILAHIGLKLKIALKDKARIICADDNKLIKKQLLAMSDMRGFLGFHMRLKKHKGKNPGKFKRYAKALMKGKKGDPILHAKKNLNAALDKFLELTRQRNQSFLKIAQKHLAGNPIIIIGGLHVEDLKKKLTELKIKHAVLVPKGYPKDDKSIIPAIRRIVKD